MGYFLNATPWLGDFIVLRANGLADSNTSENVEEPFSLAAEEPLSAEIFPRSARLTRAATDGPHSFAEPDTLNRGVSHSAAAPTATVRLGIFQSALACVAAAAWDKPRR